MPAFGRKFALFVEVNIIIFCFGTAVAYMISVGQLSQQVVSRLLGDGPHESTWERNERKTQVMNATRKKHNRERKTQTYNVHVKRNRKT